VTDEELERWLAERVMGWYLFPEGKLWRQNNHVIVRPVSDWHPLTDANDALRVVAELGNKGITYTIYQHAVELWHLDDGAVCASVFYDGIDELLRAICLAAHKALEVEP
jgi:hypothetical protein